MSKSLQCSLFLALTLISSSIKAELIPQETASVEATVPENQPRDLSYQVRFFGNQPSMFNNCVQKLQGLYTNLASISSKVGFSKNSIATSTETPTASLQKYNNKLTPLQKTVIGAATVGFVWSFVTGKHLGYKLIPALAAGALGYKLFDPALAIASKSIDNFSDAIHQEHNCYEEPKTEEDFATVAAGVPICTAFGLSALAGGFSLGQMSAVATRGVVKTIFKALI